MSALPQALRAVESLYFAGMRARDASDYISSLVVPCSCCCCVFGRQDRECAGCDYCHE